MKANTARQPQRDVAADEKGRGHGDKLDRKTEAAIVALLAHPTMAEAAKAAGVSETTLWRWLQRDDFRKKYREAQDKVFDDALGSLQGASTEAVSCLRRNLSCGNPSAEVHAARTILDYTLKARELFNLKNRIALLEAALKAREEAERAGGADVSEEEEWD
ncbi:MAG: transposase family protein [Pyrinomonadaceae bacterium]